MDNGQNGHFKNKAYICPAKQNSHYIVCSLLI
jgi:hypothetical protein